LLNGPDWKKPFSGQALDLGLYEEAVRERLQTLEQEQFSFRLWQKDPGLWKKDPKHQEVIRNALGWLQVAEKMERQLEDLLKFVAEMRSAGFRHVVHMGMGGSSLAPLAFQQIFPPVTGALSLSVLDTTDPATVLNIERKNPVGDTLFIIASKSGTTSEPLAFSEYFYARVKALKGDRAGENFVAITDPDTPLVQLASERKFRKVFWGLPDIGGRYSALSPFGLVPITLMGLNVPELLARARRMAQDCAPSVPIQENPGVVLGAAIGELARCGRDKITFLLPGSLASLGLWLEQLIAESTGKEETGILPVAGELPGQPSKYGEDRLFTYIRLRDEVDEILESTVANLQKAGQPVITIQMDDRFDLAREFFRWEIATATVGAVLGINPFDQPNVQESKDNSNRLLSEVRRSGKLPEADPTFSKGPLRFYGAGQERSAKDFFRAFFAQARPGDYFSLQAYLPEIPATTQALQTIRQLIRDDLGLANTLGYGPRFLHSTGQYHKGGPNTGLFLQLTADDAEDAPIPGQPYTFGVFKRAQALGDLEALQKHGRRVAHVHLGADVLRGLTTLLKAIVEALAQRPA